MKRIYLDHACTSFPKPAAVVTAVTEYLTENAVNINRGNYQKAYDAEETVFETRQMLCDLFEAPDPANVVFTKNITESLNVVLKGLLRPGDHILVSSMEHNAVMRPVRQLEKNGISFDRIPCGPDGSMNVSDAEKLIRPNTRAVIMLHGSNVCGTLLPIREIGTLCEKHGICFILDTAQTAAIFPISMQEMNISALCFTGHKSLLGPQGIGGFILKQELADKIDPLISGGTGSISHSEDIPSFMPDRFEAGTLNLPGIAGLKAGLQFLSETGTDRIREHELRLTDLFLHELIPLEESGLIRILIRKDTGNRCGVVSIQTTGMDIANAAYRLDAEFGIMTRVGLHCAPSAHMTLGTYPTGTIRFSFGYSNNEDEVAFASKALRTILTEV